MSATALNLRSSNWKEMKVTLSADKVAGAMDKIEDTVCVYAETKTNGNDVTAIIGCEKIVLPKAVGTGMAIAQGKKVYYDNSAKKVTVTVGSNTLVGRCLVAAGANDTTVEIEFNGTLAA